MSNGYICTESVQHTLAVEGVAPSLITEHLSFGPYYLISINRDHTLIYQSLEVTLVLAPFYDKVNLDRILH